MDQDFLSNIELYYTSSDKCSNTKLELNEEESLHAYKVMRNRVGDNIFVTDGIGHIYKTKIHKIEERKVIATIEDIFNYENSLDKFHVCIPKLKKQDRLEFALEKCVELGFTKFIFYNSKRTVAKGEKLKRLEKVAKAAMKQSLRSFLPEIKVYSSLDQIKNEIGVLLIFTQDADISLNNYLNSNKNQLVNKNVFLIFGPEGGFDDSEISLFRNEIFLKLAQNRLRTETAIITAAALINNILQ